MSASTALSGYPQTSTAPIAAPVSAATTTTQVAKSEAEQKVKATEGKVATVTTTINATAANSNGYVADQATVNQLVVYGTGETRLTPVVKGHAKVDNLVMIAGGTTDLDELAIQQFLQNALKKK